jgi:hypothetical protein
VIDPVIFAGDPPMRADGLCAVCLGPRHPERAARYAREIAAMDPFCSSTCARAWHGTSLPASTEYGRPRRLEQDAA